MVRTLEHTGGPTLGFRLTGEPGHDDFAVIMHRLDLALAQYGQARVVIVLDDPHARERFLWLWKGIDAEQRYAGRLARVAVVGAGPRRRQQLAGPLPVERVRAFGLGEIDEALLWASAA